MPDAVLFSNATSGMALGTIACIAATWAAHVRVRRVENTVERLCASKNKGGYDAWKSVIDEAHKLVTGASGWILGRFIGTVFCALGTSATSIGALIDTISWIAQQ